MVCKEKESAPIADIHCHILPGIDDGSGSMEETMEMLETATKEGITHIVCTPHYKAGRRNANAEAIKRLLATVVNEARERGIFIALYPGNEVLYFSEMEECIDSGKISTINRSGFLLVEFSPGDSFQYIRNALCDVMDMGYNPVIAHIERYECMVKHEEYATEIHELGVRIQVNASSITGETGWKLRRYTGRLLKKGIVDYVATDAHGSKKRAPYIRKCRDLLYKKYDKSYVDALLYENARRDFLLL